MTPTATATKVEVHGQKFEVGPYIDGNQMNVDDFNIATIRFADALLGTNRFTDDAADDIAIVKDNAYGDFAEACMALEEVADEAVTALNDATEDGYYWDVYEGYLMLAVNDEEA